MCERHGRSILRIYIMWIQNSELQSIYVVLMPLIAKDEMRAKKHKLGTASDKDMLKESDPFSLLIDFMT